MIAVEPRSGWPITSKDIMNNRNNGFKKLLNLCDDQENSRMTNNPCTQKNVLEHHITSLTT